MRRRWRLLAVLALCLCTVSGAWIRADAAEGPPETEAAYNEAEEEPEMEAAETEAPESAESPDGEASESAESPDEGSPESVGGSETEGSESAESGFSAEMGERLLEDMDFTKVQSMLDELLGEDSFSFSGAVKNLISGGGLFSKEAVQEFLYSLFFKRLEKEKAAFFRVLLLILIAAVFSGFAAVFEDGRIGEVSFYMVYLLLFIIIMDSFQELSGSLSEKLSWMVQLMKGLAPAYFIAVSASSGASAAAVFYEGILLLVWLIQWLLLTVLLPAANLYILLRLVNHLSREDMLSKMAELLETVIGWSLKTLLGAAVGMQTVRGLIAPVIDALKRTALGKTASAIPGVGNAVNIVTELVVTSAVLIRNCLGAAALAAFVLIGIEPVIHYGFLSLSYRFLAALAQPISDRRMVGCLGTMGEGCALLLRILLTGEVLCMLTFVILAVLQ